jgi:glyoxylase I family protein
MTGPAFSVLRLDHIVLRVRDMPRMVAFYRDVLGCPVEKVQEDLGLWQLRAGDALIDLVDVAGTIGKRGGAAPGATGHNMDHFCLRVAPWRPNDIVAAVRAAGAEIEDAPRSRYGADGQGPSLYLRDPEGNEVELKGPPDSPPEAPGMAGA